MSKRESSRIVDQLVDLAQEHGIASVQTILAHIRDELGMDAAFVSEFVDDRQIFRTLEGDAASFDLALDEGPQLDETYCRLLCEREIDPLIPDTHEVEALRSIPATEAVNIRSYLGMPISLPDGRLYGTICALSHEPRPDIKETDLRLLTLAARLIGDEIARRELEEANWALKLRSAGAEALVAALNERDGYTASHSDAVVALAEDVGEILGLDRVALQDLSQVALLHDIGKLGVPDRILHKDGSLDEDEWAYMRSHTEIGERILRSVESLRHLAPAVRSEHERWDGTGYPDGLKGEEIPLYSRIILACDALHAMTSDRPYRKAMDAGDAIDELRRNSGTQFDPEVVEALLTLVVVRHRHDDGIRAAS